jgi:hypothetical protein
MDLSATVWIQLNRCNLGSTSRFNKYGNELLNSRESVEFLGQMRDSDLSRKTTYCGVNRGYIGSIWSKMNIGRGFTL